MVFMAFMVIVQTILTFLEITGAFWLVGCLLREKVTGWRKGVLVGAIIFVGAVTSYQRTLGLYSKLYMILCIIYCGIFIFVCFRKKKRQAVLIVCLYFETTYIFHLMLYMLGVFLVPEKDWLHEVQLKMGIEHVIIYSITATIICFFMWITKNHRIWISSQLEEHTIPWIAAIVVEYAILCFCDIVMLPEHMQEGMSNGRRIALVSPLIMLVLALAYVWRRYRAELNREKNVIAVYASRYEKLAEGNNERMKLYHDMSHHLLAIRTFIENGESQAALDYLNEIYPILQTEQGLKRSPISYLVAVKEKEALAKGIQVATDCAEDWTELTTEEIRDWCSLLGNVWDNAIEGCNSINGRKWIEFSVKRVGNAVKIEMKNSCMNQHINGEVPKTTKVEKNYHGLGFQIILSIVDKHHGDMEWGCEGDIFVMRIVASL